MKPIAPYKQIHSLYQLYQTFVNHEVSNSCTESPAFTRFFASHWQVPRQVSPHAQRPSPSIYTFLYANDFFAQTLARKILTRQARTCGKFANPSSESKLIETRHHYGPEDPIHSLRVNRPVFLCLRTNCVHISASRSARSFARTRLYSSGPECSRDRPDFRTPIFFGCQLQRTVNGLFFLCLILKQSHRDLNLKRTSASKPRSHANFPPFCS